MTNIGLILKLGHNWDVKEEKRNQNTEKKYDNILKFATKLTNKNE